MASREKSSQRAAYRGNSRVRRSSGAGGGGDSPRLEKRSESKRILLQRGASGSELSSKTQSSGTKHKKINTKAIAAGRLDVAKYCKPTNLEEEKSAFFVDYRLQHAAMGLIGSPTGLATPNASRIGTGKPLVHQSSTKSIGENEQQLDIPLDSTIGSTGSGSKFPPPSLESPKGADAGPSLHTPSSNASHPCSPASRRFPKVKPLYNPQFTYVLTNKVLTQAIASKWPNGFCNKYLPHCERILKTVLSNYGTFTRYQETNGGPVLTADQCQQRVIDYLEQAGLSEHITVNYDPHLVARASMTRPNHTPTLNIRPRGNRQNWLQGTLDHEIGTHFLRDINNQRQTWGGGRGVNRKMRKRLKMDDKNPTEEGLAALHTVQSRQGHSLWRPALMYYTCYRASELSFADLFDDLHQYIENPEERWDFCLRAKRGLADTSQLGGCPKDQMYLAGALMILTQRNTIDFNELYMGKVSVRDARRLKEMGIAVTDNLVVPSFMNDITSYRAILDDIVYQNDLTDLIDCPQDMLNPPVAGSGAEETSMTMGGLTTTTFETESPAILQTLLAHEAAFASASAAQQANAAAQSANNPTTVNISNSSSSLVMPTVPPDLDATSLEEASSSSDKDNDNDDEGSACSSCHESFDEGDREEYNDDSTFTLTNPATGLVNMALESAIHEHPDQGNEATQQILPAVGSTTPHAAGPPAQIDVGEPGDLDEQYC